MPIWLISIVARAGVPQRLQRVAAGAAAALFFAFLFAAAVFGVRAWLHGREQTAVKIDRYDATAEAAKRVLAADRAATANQIDRDQVFANSQEGLRDEVRTKGTAAAVGPATVGVLERMRRDQQAGRRGTAP